MAADIVRRDDHRGAVPNRLVRYLGRAISAIVFYLGYLWMLWDSQRQCWHDKFARDVVVPVLPSEY